MYQIFVADSRCDLNQVHRRIRILARQHLHDKKKKKKCKVNNRAPGLLHDLTI
jgi:hypothetical protein